MGSCYDSYETSLKRYMTKEMSYNFSLRNRTLTWRKLWIYLAKCEKMLGVSISEEQITELEDNIDNINFERIAEIEKQIRHDVMSHIKAYGEVCPNAKPIIHLGATSCFIGDNTELILMKCGFDIVSSKILRLMKELSVKANQFKDLPTLAYTHFQPAQLTTVGKRITLWLHDILMDYENIVETKDKLKFRGVKGTVGTQASFLSLFDGDFNKVKQLDALVTEMAGFNKSYPVTSQTYSRKVDLDCVTSLSGLGASIHKICLDIRLLCGLNEISEPFEEKQVGSSAMPYKRNPMRSERCCGLSKHLMSLSMDAYQTASQQMLERSLDDSSIRRICIPEAFIIADALLHSLINIVSGLVVFPVMIMKNIDYQMPFLASEKIIVELVKSGENRDECHEKLRQISMKAVKRMKIDGLPNNFFEMILQDNYFTCIHDKMEIITDSKNYIGTSVVQVEEFLNDYINPIIENNCNKIKTGSFELNV